jgi:AI-2 transport protein TqsA
MENNRSELRIMTACLLILSTLATAFAFYWLRSVLVPFILAVFVGLILTPVIDFQVHRMRMPHPAAVALTLVLTFVVISLFGGLVTASVGRFASNVGEYQDRVEQLVHAGVGMLPLERFGIDPEKEVDLISMIPLDTTREALISMTGSVLNTFSQGLLVLLFVFFILLGSRTRETPRGGVLGQIEHNAKRYLVTKVMLSGLTGFLVYLILHFLGVNYAISFGVFAFLLNFIPNIGSVFATFLPLPVVLLAPDVSTVTIILAIALPGSVQMFVGNVLEPKLMGDSLDLHPVVILMALIFWGMLWGIPGMFLAAPLTAIMKIVFNRIEMTQPVAELMAGRIAEAD